MGDWFGGFALFLTEGSVHFAFALRPGLRAGSRAVHAARRLRGALAVRAPAITEGLANARGWPTPALERLYDGWAKGGFGLAGAEVKQDFDHHGDHDVHPAGANEGKSAIKIEEADAGVFGGGAGVEVFDGGHLSKSG